MMLLAILAIFAIVYFATKPEHRMGFCSARSTEAEEYLKKRFVTGEIDEDTYKKMLRVLRSK